MGSIGTNRLDANTFDASQLAEMFKGIGEDRKTDCTVDTVVTKTKSDEVIEFIARVTGLKYSEEQLAILKHTGGMNILACAGSGKALKNGTGVLTPNGYKAIEDLKVGDICYGDNGKEQEVLGVYPQGKKEVYEVEFSDGTVIECCKDHLWDYQTYNMRRTHKRWKTDTLEYIMDNVPFGVYPHTNKKGETHTRANIYIPMTKAVQFKGGELPIKPYLMGALLGDGGLKSSTANSHYSFTNNENDIVDRVNEELGELGAHLRFSVDKYTINVGTGYGAAGTSGLFTIKLKELGLKDTGSHTKFIPDIYKYSSVEDRIELIKGLIDTDGHCIGTAYEITLASEKLIDDIKFIVESLGMTAVKSEKVATCVNDKYYCHTLVYRLYIKTSDEIPKIHWCKRKEGQWRKGQTSARRTMVNIVKTGRFEEMTCIQVSEQSGLFLTENCVVTHNTSVLTHLLAKRILTGEISDTSKLLCTTYSKAGADEMEERLGSLFKQLGIRSTVKVQTLHAFFLMVLRHFGFDNKIISNGQRVAFILDSCREAKVSLGDDELRTVDSLLSYQVNNVMSDEALVKSYVYTLENVSQEKFKEIRTGYNQRKQKAGVIDFDDMQLYMYTLLVNQGREDILRYCQTNWTNFYIDEAQDVSKIQFAILRKLITNPDNMTFIGDDDQCLVEGTIVETNRGSIPIEELQPGDAVLTCIGGGNTIYATPDNIFKNKVDEDIVIIKIQ